MRKFFAVTAAAFAALALAGCASTDDAAPVAAPAVQVEYLEIVTPDVEATCALLAAEHGVSFSDPVPELGMARVATLAGGGRIGVRAPLRDTEEPVVRPYMLVEDIEAASAAAEATGGAIAVPPTDIPGQGKFAIYLLGGIQHGLWER
ncbi:MAG: hypothetical protein R3B98_00430 [Hyphomonas sp.]